MEEIEYSTSPEKLTDELKHSASKLMASAWEAYDKSRQYKAKREYKEAYQYIFNAIHYGIQSVCVLYSGCADANAEVGLLKHLIVSKHVCFKQCHQNFSDQYEYWKADENNNFIDKKTTRDFNDFLNETETVLKAIETYNFYVKKQVYSIKEESESLLSKKFIYISLGCVTLLFSLLYPIYKYIDPVMDYEADGQIFWRPDTNTPESEHNSTRFKVCGDGQFHDYSIDTVSSSARLNGADAIDIVSLRFDPIREQGALIWIDYIELYVRNNPIPILYSFERNKEGWEAGKDIEILELRDGCLFFNTTGRDPYLRKTDLKIKISGMKVRMKVVIYKSFFQWIFS